MKKLLITLLAMLLMTLPAQAEWDDHVLLEDKDCGGCTALTGDVRLVVVMVSVDGHPWPVGAQLQMMQEVQKAAQKLEAEAADWGVSLDLQPEWHEATAATSAYMDATENWADAVLTSIEGLPGRTDARYADTPIIFCLSSTGRAFAHTEWARSEAEFAFLYAGDDEAVLRHELLHLYGAEDYYVQADIEAAAEALCPDSIMLEGLNGDRVDPLTAYLIGWTEELDKAAEDFLSMTAHVTTGMFEDARLEDQATGYRIVTWENGTYSGMLVDGFEHGWGEFRWNNGDVYAGSWSWGELHGQGAYTWADGVTYIGDYVNGVRTGKGVMTFPDGVCYAGDFVDDTYHGKGTMTFPNGAVYTGDFVMDALTGQGMYTWPDGATYTGEVKDGRLHGKGTYTWANGQSYTGEFVNDTMANGQALTVWVDGTTYVGDVADGNRNGKGTLIRPDGSVYTGGFANGAKDGQGLWLMTDGTVYLGDFSGDVRHGQGLQISSNGAVCTGDFSNGYLHGQGTQILPDGTRYTGGFHCGLYHGEGTLVSPEGGVTVGVWEFGELINVK